MDYPCVPFFNDIDIKNWKNSEVWTDSLWIIPQRDKTGKQTGFYHGSFVPQKELSYGRQNKKKH